MMAKKRYVATWSTMPGAFYDSDDMNDALAFAQIQHSHLSPRSVWQVGNIAGGGVGLEPEWYPA